MPSTIYRRLWSYYDAPLLLGRQCPKSKHLGCDSNQAIRSLSSSLKTTLRLRHAPFHAMPMITSSSMITNIPRCLNCHRKISTSLLSSLSSASTSGTIILSLRRSHPRDIVYQRLMSSSTSSSRSTPTWQISTYGAVFGLLLLPALGFSIYFLSFGPADATIEEEVRERYSQEVRTSHDKNAAMKQLYRQVILGEKHDNPNDIDDQVKQVMYGGKGEKRRMHPLEQKQPTNHDEEQHTDPSIMTTIDDDNSTKKKKKKHKKKPSSTTVTNEDTTKAIDDVVVNQVTLPSSPPGMTASQIVVVTILTSVVAVAGFLSGSK